MNTSALSVPQSDTSISTTKIKSTTITPGTVKKKEGLLYKKSDHLKVWRKRFFSCENNFLKISHNESGKNLRIIDLNSYIPSWQGKMKDKYVFAFQLRTGLKLKPKALVLSAAEESVAREWFQFFISVMETSALLAGQTHIINELGTRVRSHSQEHREELAISPTLNESQTDLRNPVFPDCQPISKRRSISVGARNKEVETEPPSMDSSSMQTSMAATSDYNQSRMIDATEKLADNTLNLSSNPVPVSNRTSQASSHYASQNFLTERISAIPKKISARHGIKPAPKFRDFVLPKDAPKWVDHLFEKYIRGKQMWRAPTEEKINTEEWNIIKDNGQLRIMQSFKKPNLFKGLYCLENKTSSEKLLQVLLDVQNRNKWDSSFGKAAMLSYIPSTKQCVIHQVTKPFGMFYFPREFIYARYVFKTLDAYFIIDQSVQEAHQIKKSLTIPRGEIFYSIMQIKKEGHEVYLNIMVNITNGGMVSTVQDTQINLHSLMNINNVQKVFDQYPEWDDFELAFMPTSDNDSQRESIAMDMRMTVAKVSGNLNEVQQDGDEINVQNPLDSSNIMNELEKDDVPIKSEESKDEEDLKNMLSPLTEKKEELKEPETVSLTQQILSPEKSAAEEPEDLNLLLEKVWKFIPALECIDPNFPKKELTPALLNAVITDEENPLLNGKIWKRDPANGLRFVDDDFLTEQKKVLGHFLRSMGKNFLEGKSIMSVSLPITIFSGESMLQRCSSSFGYAPTFLTAAGKQTDKLEAFKYVIATYFSSVHMGIAQIKPFNPILGETYQGVLGGIPILCEQISHHPPITALHMKTEDFFLHGTSQLDASLGPNSATAQEKRRLCVTLPRTNLNVYVYFPTALVSGTAFGKRLFNWSKKMRVYEPENLFYAEITFNPDEKGMIGNLFAKKTLDADRIKGTIYKVTPEFMQAVHKKEGSINNDAKAKFDAKNHAVEELAQIDGSWVSYLDIDGKRIWDIETMKPYKLIDQPNKTLPSNSTFREDLIYRKMEDLVKGQEWKDKLENAQRADRKLREKTSKAKH